MIVKAKFESTDTPSYSCEINWYENEEMYLVDIEGCIPLEVLVDLVEQVKLHTNWEERE